MVEPYMLSRGAGAQGPTEVVKLMQKNLKRPTVLYFCLMSIAKMELRGKARWAWRRRRRRRVCCRP